MIPILYVALGERDSECIQQMLEEKEIKFEIKHMEAQSPTTMRELITEIRTHRTDYGKTPGPKDKWTATSLMFAPILKTNLNTYPWWYLREHAPNILASIKREQKRQESQQPKKKLKIHRIYNKHNHHSFAITKEAEARINVTILRVINGVNIIEIMSEWSMGEKAAAMIAWRYAQHNNAELLDILADQLRSKAKFMDPYKQRRDNM